MRIALIRISISILGIAVAGLLLFGKRDIPVDELKLKYAPAPSAFLSIDGMQVHYRDEGNTADTLPILLIHGTASSLHTFDAWSASLKGEKRVVRLDLPGFGLTGPFPDHNYDVDRYVNFMHHFLRTLGVRRCILAGNSLGGQISWKFTVRHPEMVSKLILIDAAGYPLQASDGPIAFKLAKIPVLGNLLTVITPRFMVKASVEKVYGDKTKVTKELLDRYYDLTLREGNRRALVDRIRLRLDTGSLPLIKSIKQRTLILWGEKDTTIPLVSAYRFAHDLPNDTLVILKDLGHVPMEENPEESLVVVRSFLGIP